MNRRFRAPLISLVLALACNQAPPAHGTDSLGVLLTRLDPMLAPLVASRDSMIVVLRRDSGTVRADSEFVQFRGAFGIAVRKTVKSFSDSAFDSTVYPRGYHEKTLRFRRRADGTQYSMAEAVAADSVADSVRTYLQASGVWTGQGEGGLYLDASETALLGSVGRFLSVPTQAYLRIVASEQTHPPADDASLMISWDELGDFVARCERLLLQYPNAVVRDSIREKYEWYLRFYLLGADNSLVFSRRSHELDPEVRRSYERYVTKYAALPSGGLMRGYLDVLRANGYRYGRPVVEFARAHSRLANRSLPPP